MTLLAAAQEPDAGWGKLTALLVAGLLFWIGVSMYERYTQVRGKPLPQAAERGALEGVNPQAIEGSDPKMTLSPAASPGGEPDLDGFVRTHAGRARPSKIIKAARKHFGVSESTVKRRLRRARGGES